MDQDRRREARIAVNLAVSCRIPARPVRGTIEDISYEGCRIRMSDALAELGATAMIMLPGCEPVTGIVVWKDINTIGVCFVRALDEQAAIFFGLTAAEAVDEPEEKDEPHEAMGLCAQLHHWIRKQVDVAA
jgi:hypothetical protein